MGWGNIEIDSFSELLAAKGREFGAPDLPEFPTGNAAFQIAGDPPAAEEIVAIQSLHDIYNENLAELKTAFKGRERARIAREAHLKANPPLPRDITVNYWQIGTPAAAGNGGAK